MFKYTGKFYAKIIRFNNIPANEPVQIIITGVKDGKVVCCSRSVNASPDEINNLAFDPITPEQFKQHLESHFYQMSPNIETKPGTQPGTYS